MTGCHSMTEPWVKESLCIKYMISFNCMVINQHWIHWKQFSGSFWSETAVSWHGSELGDLLGLVFNKTALLWMNFVLWAVRSVPPYPQRSRTVSAASVGTVASPRSELLCHFRLAHFLYFTFANWPGFICALFGRPLLDWLHDSEFMVVVISHCFLSVM